MSSSKMSDSGLRADRGHMPISYLCLRLSTKCNGWFVKEYLIRGAKAEALARAHESVGTAERESVAYEAAVNCFLQG